MALGVLTLAAGLATVPLGRLAHQPRSRGPLTWLFTRAVPDARRDGGHSAGGPQAAEPHRVDAAGVLFSSLGNARRAITPLIDYRLHHGTLPLGSARRGGSGQLAGVAGPDRRACCGCSRTGGCPAGPVAAGGRGRLSLPGRCSRWPRRPERRRGRGRARRSASMPAAAWLPTQTGVAGAWPARRGGVSPWWQAGLSGWWCRYPGTGVRRASAASSSKWLYSGAVVFVISVFAGALASGSSSSLANAV